jgi:hypothetical protein
MSDIENNIEIKPEKKKRNKPSKYTEEEKKEKFLEYQKKYVNKPEIKEKRNEYYKARYHALDEKAKKKFSQNFLTKYHNMTDDEYKNYLNQCKPYKRKYHHKKADEKKLLDEEQQIITMKERKYLIKNISLDLVLQNSYNNLICV